VQPWPAVGPHGGEECQADAEVVEQARSLAGQVWPLRLEIAPWDHAE
jgi:hypothetical protein